MKKQYLEDETSIVIKNPPILLIGGIKGFMLSLMAIIFVVSVAVVTLIMMSKGIFSILIWLGLTISLSAFYGLLRFFLDSSTFIVTQEFIAKKNIILSIFAKPILSIEKKEIQELVKATILDIKNKTQNFDWVVTKNENKYYFSNEEIQAISKIMQLPITIINDTKTP